MKRFLSVMFAACMALCMFADGVTYSVNVPEGTNQCYLYGEATGNTFLRMKKASDGTYSVTVPTANITLTYNYASGNGEQYREVKSDGKDVDPRTYKGNDIVTAWKAVAPADGQDPSDDPSIDPAGPVFNVTVPDGTPAVYIAGTFNEWSFTTMERVDNTHYRLTVNKVNADELLYKYTCGADWKYVEVNADGTEVANRSYHEADVVAKWKEVPGDDPQPGTTTYYITGETLVGGWDAKQQEMKDGVCVFENLAAGTYQFKVTDGSWADGHNWGGAAVSKAEGAEVSTAADGNVVMVLSVESNVTISFDGEHITIVAVATGEVPPQLPQYYLTGETLVGGWDAKQQEMKDGVCVFENLAAGTYQFKVTDGSWADGHNWGGAAVSSVEGAEVSTAADGNVVMVLSVESNVTILFDGEHITIVAVPTGVVPPDPGEGLTYNVTVPEGTPAVYIAGEFNKWTFAAMEKVDDTHYTVTIGNAKATDGYKYLCGEDWKYVEKDAEGGEVADRTYSENDVVAKWAAVPGDLPQPEGVTYNVTVPEGTPAVYIAGAWDEFASFTAMTKVDDTHYTITLENATTAHGYKYLCGDDWKYVEKDAEGNEIADRTYSENDVVAKWAAVPGDQPHETIYYITGESLVGGWDAKQEQLGEGSDGKYIFMRTLEGGTYEFKITDGSWDEGHNWGGDAVSSVVGATVTTSADGNVVMVIPEKSGVTIEFDGEHITIEAVPIGIIPPDPGEGLTFNVTVPEGTPAVYIAGAWDEFASFTAMTKVDDTHYTITLENATAAMGYKYLCGEDWKYVEKDAEGNEIADRTYSENDVVAKWAAVPGDQPQPEGLTYNVTVPEGTPAVYIAGAWDEFASFTAMTKVDDTHYTITLENATTAMGYKYLCGEDWKYVEKDAEGNEIADRTYSENDVVAKWAAVPGDLPQPGEGLTYNVTVPEGTPAVYIAGDFNGWTFTPMTKVDDTHYTITIEGATTADGYKYLCGDDWKYEETDQQANRVYSENDVVKGWKLTPGGGESITYNVTVPEGTPAVYIAGDFNGWSFTPMTKVDDTHYTITIDGATTAMGYKYLCGPDWKYEEIDQTDNRTYSENDVVKGWKAIPGDISGLNSSVVINYWVENSTLNVNLVGAQRVMMFDVNGRMVDNRMSNDFYQIQLPAGVYMLRVDSSVVKVAIR